MEEREDTPVVNPWFDAMMKEDLKNITIQECIDAAKRTGQEFEETAVIETEISRIANRLKETGGVDQQTRVSIESYIPEDDESLPMPLSYTQDATRVNYEDTVTWLDARANECQKQAIHAGVSKILSTLLVINSFAFEPETAENRLTTLRNRATTLFQEHIGLKKAAVLPVDEAVQPLAVMATQLQLTEEDVDLSNFYDTLDRPVVPKVTQVLNTIGSVYVAPALDPFLEELTLIDSCANGFKSYLENMDNTLVAVIHAIKAGLVTGTAVAPITPVLDEVEACTLSYTVKLKPKGSSLNPTLDDIDFVINTLFKFPLLIDPERDVRDKLMDAANALSIAFNLTETKGETSVEVKQPDTLLSCIKEIVIKLDIIAEVIQVRRDVYDRLENLMQRKVTLYEAYSVYLSCLAE